jgi:benzoyl-CoA reductase/2-hydroxyglutaryl-CoA dehydratase subunit BcrC/BadD/HgdB
MGISKTIGYCSPYIPVEWISAHQLVPLKLTPGASPVDAPVAHLPGLCPFARAYGNTCSLSNDLTAVLFSSRCDQMRRMSELVSLVSEIPTHLFYFPHTRTRDIAESHLRNELDRLSSFLLNLGGQTPSNELLAAALHHTYSRRAVEDSPPSTTGKKRLALLGGPLLEHHRCIYDMIRAWGGAVVLDGTESGKRCIPRFSLEQMAADPYQALIEGYLECVADPFARPNDDFYEWLTQHPRRSSIDGIVILRYLWCDGWHAEVQRIKECMGVPVLDIDVEEGPFETERTVTRIKAFLEVMP